MATMGTRKVASRQASKLAGAPGRSPLAAPVVVGFNLIIPAAEIAPVTQRGIESPVVGLPIMREGFVTETGFLPPTLSTQTTLAS